MASLAFRDPAQVTFDFEPGFAGVRPASLRCADEPRELPLRSLSGAHGGRFTAWRGRSGRRYVSSSFAIHDEDALSFADAVLIAVGADRSVLAVREAGPWGLEAAVTRWRDEAAAAGACEIHVHLIAASAEDRRRAVADLTPVH